MSQVAKSPLPQSLARRLQGSRWELLRQSARDFWSGRHVAWELLRRNLAGEYRQSLMGVGLAFVPALVTAAWCTLIRHANIVNIPELDVPYPAFVLLSMMLWTTFVEAINAPIHGLIEELPTLARSSYPVEAIVLARMGQVLFDFGVKLVLVVGAVYWFSLPISWTVILAPLGLVLLVLFGTSLGMLLAPINALYRDISKGLAAITTFWLFLTPVLIPVPTSGWAALIVKFNPVTPLLVTTRELVTTAQLSNLPGFLLMAILTLLLFAASCLFHRVAVPVVIDRTNA